MLEKLVRRLALLGVAILGFPAASFAQSVPFIEPAQHFDMTPLQQAVLNVIKRQPTSASVELVKVNPQALLTDQLLLKFNSSANIVIGNVTKASQSGSMSDWLGAAKSAVDGSTALVVNAKNVIASIQSAEGLYTIQPLGGGLHALIKIDPRKTPPEHPPGFKDKSSHSSQDAFPYLPHISPTTTTITVLVGYTPAVKAALGDIDGSIVKQLAQLAVADTNTSYKNSAVNIDLVAAPADPVLVNLRETGDMDQEVKAFAADPTVQRVRAANQSNVAVLLTADDSACGDSMQIYATKQTAFSVVYYNCELIHNYSFAHEIGHLQGARHNPEDDPANSPVAYCHGFMDPVNKRRTIMSYDCPNGGCTRVPEWARPTDYGNVTISNDARVLNETATYIASFR